VVRHDRQHRINERRTILGSGSFNLGSEGHQGLLGSFETYLTRLDVVLVGGIVDHYNQERLHSALEFQTPATWYRGNPEEVTATRQLKLSQARHRRKQFNLEIRQRTFPFPETLSATCN